MFSFGFFGMTLSILIAVSITVVAVLGFGGVVFYFLSQAFNSEDALVVDTREEALNRKI